MDEKILYGQIEGIVNDPLKLNMIMSLLFPENVDYHFTKCSEGHFFKTNETNCNYCQEKKSSSNSCENLFDRFFTLLKESEEEEITELPVKDVFHEYKVDKKKEILDSLKYLKSKEFKTKQDKDSIYTLEMVLKNFS